MRIIVATRIELSVSMLLEKGGGMAALALGLVITVAVQSSSITTSVLVPLAAAGVISVRNVYPVALGANRSEEHTSELQSLMRISYAVFCLKKKKYAHRRNGGTATTAEKRS